MTSRTENQEAKGPSHPSPGGSAGGLSKWFAELRRRRVFRALVAYGIAAFAALQVVEPIMHGAHWPEVVLSYVVAGLGAGFPIVIALAWIFDVKGGRIQRTAPAAAATGPRGVRLALLLFGIGVLAAAPGVLYYFVVRSTGGSHSAASTTSIAILPFASLSASGEDNAWFAQGFHDELLRQMGRVGDLQVISRTSVMQYKEGARNLREIAEALGVSSVVEGSVQRSGNRVRVEARLIDARSDKQIWGDRYDRDLTDVFGIQTAVADEIANALHARLSAEQKARMARRPTENVEAYDLYLRALEYHNRPSYQPNNFGIAERLYRQAIQADPSFALARARLAQTRLLTYLNVAATPESVAEEAREEAEQSLRLQPDLPEGHLALGFYYHQGRRDYDRALQEFEVARSGVPAEAIRAIGFVLRRQGRFDEAIGNFQKAVNLDPRSPNTLYELALTFYWTRRYEEADRVLDRALAIAPDSVAASIVKALLHEAWKGETALSKALLRTTPGRLDLRSLLPLTENNPREALLLLDSVEFESIAGTGAVYSKAFLYALAHEALGDAARARTEYETALPLLQAEVDKNQGRGRALQLSLLARAYAGLGRKEDALREASRAVESLRISKDALGGYQLEVNRASVEARVGETDAAIEHIRRLLSIPCPLSPALLRIDPRWAPLRDDPRFQKLAELERE